MEGMWTFRDNTRNI